MSGDEEDIVSSLSRSLNRQSVFPLKSLGSVSIKIIGHCSTLVAASTGCRSIVVRYLAFVPFGSRCSAAYQAVSSYTFRKLTLTSFFKVCI